MKTGPKTELRTKLIDLSGLKCPLPALRTRKALLRLPAGHSIEVHSTDPLAMIDVPNAVREAGGLLEAQHRDGATCIFIIRKVGGPDDHI